jgi:hypothetical protein
MRLLILRSTSTTTGLLFPSFLEQRLEFGDHLEVAGPARGALELDEPFERDAKKLATKSGYFLGMRE